jgi:putative sigma-54 modulation protein
MDIKITARHLEVTDAIRSYLQKKVEKLENHHSRIESIEAILEESEGGFTTELIVKESHSQKFAVHVIDDDLYAAIDLISDKAERQLTKHREKLNHHKGRQSMGQALGDAVTAQSEDEDDDTY